VSINLGLISPVFYLLALYLSYEARKKVSAGASLCTRDSSQTVYRTLRRKRALRLINSEGESQALPVALWPQISWGWTCQCQRVVLRDTPVEVTCLVWLSPSFANTAKYAAISALLQGTARRPQSFFTPFLSGSRVQRCGCHISQRCYASGPMSLLPVLEPRSACQTPFEQVSKRGSYARLCRAFDDTGLTCTWL
jgi:hypothetical protein